MSDLCGICLDPCLDEPLNYVLECNHKFHTSCIEEWFKYTYNCPYCRKDIKLSFKGYDDKEFKKQVHVVLNDNGFDFIYNKDFLYNMPFSDMNKITFLPDRINFEIFDKKFKFKFKTIFIKSNIQLESLEIKMRTKLRDLLVNFI